MPILKIQCLHFEMHRSFKNYVSAAKFMNIIKSMFSNVSSPAPRLNEKYGQSQSWESVLYDRLSKGFKPGETDSQNSSEDYSKEERQESKIHKDICQQRPGSWNIRKLPLIKENQTFQVFQFSTFLRMYEKIQESGLIEFISSMAS